MTIFKDRMGRVISNKEAVSKIKIRVSNWILDFELMILRWVGHIPFHNIRRFFYSLAGIKMGKGSAIHMFANFFNPKNIIIGEDTIIGKDAFLDGREKLIIGSHVDIASEVMIYNSEHDVNSKDFRAVSSPVEVGDYVFVGPRVVVLPGVKIGKGAVIAAGAVVSKDVSDFEIAGGIPAVKIGERKYKNFRYRLGRARLFQ